MPVVIRPKTEDPQVKALRDEIARLKAAENAKAAAKPKPINQQPAAPAKQRQSFSSKLGVSRQTLLLLLAGVVVVVIFKA